VRVSIFFAISTLVPVLAADAPWLWLEGPPARSTDSDAVELRGAAWGEIENIYWMNQLGERGDVKWTRTAAHPGVSWTASVPLHAGVNRITVIGADGANRSASAYAAILRSGSGPTAPSELRAGLYGGRPVVYESRGGMAVIEGDIIIGPADSVPDTGSRPQPHKLTHPVRSGRVHTYGFTDSYVSLLWPLVGGVRQVPYTIQNGATNLTAALQAFNTALTGVIQFVPQTMEANYVTFNFDSSNMSGSCESAVGMQGSQQFVSGAVNCTVATLLHEMGHTVGLLHEHQRPDRANFITFTPANTDKPFILGNLDMESQNYQTVGLYDYASVMHYPPFVFTKNNLPVLESVPAGIPLSNSNGYSAGDLDQIQRLYGLAPSSVTVTTNPPGLKIIVDNITYTAPQTFSWTLNSTHTLNLPADPQQTNPADGSSYEFGKWNDLGTRSHSVTVIGGTGALTSPANKPAVTVYEANFIQLQPFADSVTPAGTGSITVSPAPQSIFGGSYFVNRKSITLTAKANAGQNFYGWFGLPYPQGGSPYKMLVLSPASSVQAAFTTSPVTVVGETITGPNTWNPPLYGYVDTAFTYFPQGYSQPYSGAGWAAGTSHSVNAPNPDVPVTSNVSYSWNSWSDSGAQTHNIKAASSGVKKVTASYTPVYRSYAYAQQSCGVVQYSPACTNNDCSFSDGTSVTMTAIPNGGNGMVFAGWTGDLSGTTNPQSTTIHDEFLPVANFNVVPTIITITGTVPSLPVASSSGLTLTVNGTGFVSGNFFAYWNGSFRSSTVVSSTQATVTLLAGDLANPGGQSLQVSNFTASCGASAFGQVLVLATAGPPQLTVSKTHTGNFTKGQQGGTYTVTVGNSAAATGSTSGTVTLAETVPSGLTLVSMAGSGWSCSGTKCTRSDALAPGNNYSAITVTVNVSQTAPPSVINKVTVSGGGSAKATASDKTTIN